MSNIEHILGKDERLVWKGRPQLLRYVLQQVGAIVIILLIYGFFRLVTDNSLNSTGSSCTINDRPASPEECAAFTNVIANVALSLIPIVIAGSWLLWYNTWYYVTNRRILLEGGIFGTDYHSIMFERVENTNVNVNVLDKICGTGTVNAMTTGGVDIVGNTNKIACIEDPYALYRTIQEQVDAAQKRGQ